MFALLGPNGAGKTTTVRILATLTRADAGQARVAGFDVVADRRQVRRRISLTGQYAAVDELQTGEENLRMMGRLAGLPGARGPRAGRPSCWSGSTSPRPAGRTVATYSGGMRRRLDLAAGLVGRPVGDLPGRADHRPGPAQPPGGVAGRRRPGRLGGDRAS